MELRAPMPVSVPAGALTGDGHRCAACWALQKKGIVLGLEGGHLTMGPMAATLRGGAMCHLSDLSRLPSDSRP